MRPNEGILPVIQQVIEDCTGQVKWSGLNALEYLKTSTELASSHPELSAFSAICAEEEAAACLIHSIKALKYPEAKKIRFTSHPHKHAVFVFIRNVVDWFEAHQSITDWPFRSPVFQVKPQGERKAIHLVLPLKSMSLSVNPHPPLNFDVEGASTLESQLVEHMTLQMQTTKIEEVRKLIEKSANHRNLLLYADSKGLPKLSGDIDTFITVQTEKVAIMLTAVGLIDPWSKFPHSPIVITCISLLLKFMDRTFPSEN